MILFHLFNKNTLHLKNIQYCKFHIFGYLIFLAINNYQDQVNNKSYSKNNDLSILNKLLMLNRKFHNKKDHII